MNLFPRLDLGFARSRASEVAPLSVDDARSNSGTSSEFALFAPTGGAPVPEETLIRLRAQLREAARHQGYPRPPSRSGQAEWDVSAALALHGGMGIAPAEAMNAGVWAFLGCVLMPDLVRWRFWGEDATSLERFLGGNRGLRNTFGRLWWRAESLGAGEGEDGRRLARRYLVYLGEDQLVQITERPEAFADARLARAVAEAYVFYSPQAGVPSELFMREAIKRIRRRLAFTCWEILPEETMVQEVRAIFEDTMDVLGGSLALPV